MGSDCETTSPSNISCLLHALVCRHLRCKMIHIQILYKSYDYLYCYNQLDLLMALLLPHTQLMTFSQHHLEWLSKETYAGGGGRGNGRGSETRSLPQATQNGKSEKKYGLITKEDRYSQTPPHTLIYTHTLNAPFCSPYPQAP